MGREAECRWKPQISDGVPSPSEQAPQINSGQPAKGYESQGMSEVPMVVEKQQWVVAGANENIDVRQCATEGTHPQGGLELGPPCTRLSGCGTDGSLGDGIHCQ